MSAKEPQPESTPDQPKPTASIAEAILKSIDLSSLPDERWRECVRQLLNLVESLTAELRKAQAENQYLREQLKRGGGGPASGGDNLGGSPEGAEPKPRSSEKERGEKGKKWKKRRKLERIRVDREQKLSVDRAGLPADAEFKGYEAVVTQDLRICTDNVRFLKEKYYSPSEKKTYLAPLPVGYHGEFGPGVKAVCLMFG